VTALTVSAAARQCAAAASERPGKSSSITCSQKEELYLKEYAAGWQAEESLTSYFRFCCHQRMRQSLDYRTPATVYRDNGSLGRTARSPARRLASPSA
jgi:hypothetical protein